MLMSIGEARKRQVVRFAPHLYCENEPKLVRAVTLAWKRIPSSARKTLLNYWASRVGTSPLIGISDVMDGDRLGQATEYYQVEYKFPRKVLRLPLEVAALLVAHEFAHHFLLATGVEPPFEGEYLEAAVNGIAVGWGFGPGYKQEFLREFNEG